MAEVKFTQINLRPVQEFTGDRVKQVQRVNNNVRTGIAQRIHQVRDLTHSTLLASMGLGGLAYDNAWRRIVDSWEFLDKAELRGEEIEQNMTTRLSDRVQWTVRRFSIPSQKNGSAHLPLTGYDELSAHEIIDMVGQVDVDKLEAMRAYEANGKARVTVLRAIDSQLRKKLAVA